MVDQYTPPHGTSSSLRTSLPFDGAAPAALQLVDESSHLHPAVAVAELAVVSHTDKAIRQSHLKLNIQLLWAAQHLLKWLQWHRSLLARSYSRT